MSASLLFLATLVLGPWATTAFGQYTTARLSGTVQDKSGAAVPGATVTIVQAGTGYQQQVKSGKRVNTCFRACRLARIS